MRWLEELCFNGATTKRSNVLRRGPGIYLSDSIFSMKVLYCVKGLKVLSLYLAKVFELREEYISDLVRWFGCQVFGQVMTVY